MSNVELSRTSLRETGNIKLHGAEAFAAMRKAGRLAAEALDMIGPYVRPGVTTDIQSHSRVFALRSNVKWSVKAPKSFQSQSRPGLPI